VAEAHPGKLVLVATPIGNLGDISPRAVQVLGDADVVACEDTRRTGRLLVSAGVRAKRLVAVHEHNERGQAEALVQRMLAGDVVALVTDAGTPAISDPGERVVAAAAEAGLVIEIVPGPSAVIAALAVSGLPTERFCFDGFLPRKGRLRAERIAAIAGEARTTVLYEAPHRVAATVADLALACGDGRRIALARELTKRFEEVWRGTLAEAVAHTVEVEARGEYVLVVEGAPLVEATEADLDAALQAQLNAGADKRTAIATVAGQLRLPRRQVYQAALRLAPGR